MLFFCLFLLGRLTSPSPGYCIRTDMNVERYLRLIAGFFVMASVALGYWVHPGFLWFTGFVGLNLFQSAFTNWCPMITFLRKLGVREASA
jgi:hypothetical protein